MRFWIGSCPPSNPGRTPPPARAFWPLWPRPDVLPLPEPIPRPTRVRSVLAPSFGLRSFKLIGIVCLISSGERIERSWSDLRFAVFDNHQVPHLREHAACGWGVDHFHGLVDPSQPEAGNGSALIRRSANHAANQRHLDHLRLFALLRSC